jgi:hypothetical protein
MKIEKIQEILSNRLPDHRTALKYLVDQIMKSATGGIGLLTGINQDRREVSRPTHIPQPQEFHDYILFINEELQKNPSGIVNEQVLSVLTNIVRRVLSESSSKRDLPPPYLEDALKICLRFKLLSSVDGWFEGEINLINSQKKHDLRNRDWTQLLEQTILIIGPIQRNMPH